MVARSHVRRCAVGRYRYLHPGPGEIQHREGHRRIYQEGIRQEWKTSNSKAFSSNKENKNVQITILFSYCFLNNIISLNKKSYSKLSNDASTAMYSNYETQKSIQNSNSYFYCDVLGEFQETCSMFRHYFENIFCIKGYFGNILLIKGTIYKDKSEFNKMLL